jgi:PAS domain S-box-containing protein
MTETPPPTPVPPPGDAVNEARLEAVLESVSDGFYAVDASWRYVVFNRAAEEYFGVSRDEVMGRSLWDVFPQGIGTSFERYCRRAMVERLPTTVETPSRMRPDRTVELRIVPMGDGGVAVSLTDVTERRRAEDALRAARDRSEEILESISDAFYAVDADWRFTYVNRKAEDWWGRKREALIGKVYFEEFPQLLGTVPWQAHERAMTTRQVVRAEVVSAIIGRWIDLSIFPSGAGLSVYFRDITERKEAERRQKLLVNELNHRVKNCLTVVQAMVRQTLGASQSLADAQAALTDRLMALAAAHDVITREDWTGAGLAEVVSRSVAPQIDRPDRLSVHGPAVVLSPQSALSFSLAFHELVTNATKYGALASEGGRIALSWDFAETVEGRRLKITWRESGGPPVVPPSRKGFGTRLIERGLAAEIGGAVSLSFHPDGVVCEIDADLDRTAAGEVAAALPPVD